MKLSDIQKSLSQERAENTVTIFMPSIKKDLKFRHLNTEDLKTLSRIGIFNDFDLNNELLKLSLFDKLLADPIESSPLTAEKITQIDYLAFLIGLRKLLRNELSFEFTCQQCEKRFVHKLDLEAEFSDFLFNYEKKILYLEKLDNLNNIWKFELTSYTMKTYLYYRYYIERLKEIDINNPDLLNEEKFLRPLLYISKIWKNDEEIEDWNNQLLGEKIRFFNALPAELIIDSTGADLDDTYLSTFIAKNFIEEKFIKAIDNIKIICPNEECKEEYTGIYTFEDFSTF